MLRAPRLALSTMAKARCAAALARMKEIVKDPAQLQFQLMETTMQLQHAKREYARAFAAAEKEESSSDSSSSSSEEEEGRARTGQRM